MLLFLFCYYCRYCIQSPSRYIFRGKWTKQCICCCFYFYICFCFVVIVVIVSKSSACVVVFVLLSLSLLYPRAMHVLLFCLLSLSLLYPVLLVIYSVARGQSNSYVVVFIFTVVFVCCHCRYCIRSPSLYIPWQGDSSAAGVTKYKIFRSLLSSTLLTIILSLPIFLPSHL